MVDNPFRPEKLEELLQARWGDFLDPVQLLRTVMEHVRDNGFKVLKQQEIPPRQARLTITKFQITDRGFEFWAEFSVPKDDGVVIGTSIYQLVLSGGIVLTESFGTHFVPEKA